MYKLILDGLHALYSADLDSLYKFIEDTDIHEYTIVNVNYFTEEVLRVE